MRQAARISLLSIIVAFAVGIGMALMVTDMIARVCS